MAVATVEESVMEEVERVIQESTQGPGSPVNRSRTITKDLLKVLNLEVRDVPVRSSGRNRLEECARKFMFEERLGLVPHRYSPALEIGSFFHELVAPLYLGKTPDDLDKLVGLRVQALYTQFEKQLNPAGLLPNGKTIGEMMTTLEKDLILAGALVKVFSKYLPPSRMLEKYEVVDVEKMITIRIPGVSVPLVIQPDVLLRSKRTGHYWIVDHKTTGVGVYERAAVLGFEFQPKFYEFVLKTALKKQDPEAVVGGYIHNIIRKPGIRRKLDETTEGYIKRVHQWFEDEHKANPEEPPILQSIVRGHAKTDETLLAAVYKAAKASSARLNLARYPHNTKACFGMFGNSVCPFLPLCQNEDKMLEEWPAYIKEHYTQQWRHWEDTK